MFFKIRIFFLFITMVFVLNQLIVAQNYPFPQNQKLEGVIYPSNTTFEEINQIIKTYYDAWKSKFIKTTTTIDGGYYVEYKGYADYEKVNFKTVSEAHGYGMIIMALMAGYDPEAKTIFDGMLKVYQSFPSIISGYLMSWILPEDEDYGKRSDCATDGDMDVAYALILAYLQWGDENYLSKAKTIIENGIKMYLVDDLKRLRLGDWATDGEYLYSTRSSDWMPEHLKLYKVYTNDNLWTEVVDTIYSLINQIQTAYSPNTGLLPDFIVGEVARPADPNFLESDYDGHYYWNACRDPWRLSMDYIHTQDERAKVAVSKMLDWVIERTGGDPSQILAGYKLDGTAIPGSYSGDPAFVAPFVTAGMIDSKYQDWLNAGWNYLKDQTPDEYYQATLTLLNMLVISGNWWNPFNLPTKVKKTKDIDKKLELNISPNPFNPKAHISFNLQEKEKVSLKVYDLNGRLVKVLIEDSYLKEGVHNFTFDGKGLSSGMYLVVLEGENIHLEKKAILIK